jgi:hypothetical protein
LIIRRIVGLLRVNHELSGSIPIAVVANAELLVVVVVAIEKD